MKLRAACPQFVKLCTVNFSIVAAIVMASFSISIGAPNRVQSPFLLFYHPNYSVHIIYPQEDNSTTMMRSFTPLAVALLLPAVLACENPDSHPCASVFTASTALVSSFCATYTASDVTATTAIPSAINSACSSKSLTISEQCTCFVTGATATTTAKVSMSVIYVF
jgi:hypothetical protein